MKFDVWLNFIEALRTIEKSKETIVNGPNKVMVPATGLWERSTTNLATATVAGKFLSIPASSVSGIESNMTLCFVDFAWWYMADHFYVV